YSQITWMARTSPSTTNFLCFSLCLRPPNSTLFPYTTLFRSDEYSSTEGALTFTSGWMGVDLSKYSWDEPLGNVESNAIQSTLQQDRKSTRLNSSHVKISYAVFCLKKKNNIKYRIDE